MKWGLFFFSEASRINCRSWNVQLCIRRSVQYEIYIFRFSIYTFFYCCSRCSELVGNRWFKKKIKRVVKTRRSISILERNLLEGVSCMADTNLRYHSAFDVHSCADVANLVLTTSSDAETRISARRKKRTKCVEQQQYEVRTLQHD